MSRLDDRELAELARELPFSASDDTRRQALRDAIVLEAQELGPVPAPRRRALWLGAAAALLGAAAVLLLVLRSDPTSPPPAPPGLAVTATHRATVQASSAADFVHSARRDGAINDEVVRLRGGRVSVAVEKLAPDQRFRVIAGDGEVEVRGTAFDVVVVGDRLEAVIVNHGLVLVRLGDAAAVEVAGGQQWTRPDGVTKLALSPLDPVPVPVPATAPVPVPVPVPVPATAPVPVPVPAAGTAVGTATASDTAPAAAPAADTVAETDTDTVTAPVTVTATATEASFREGRLALRDGDFGSAADLFSLAIAADPTAPLAEDARYWRGVALARAGRDAAARAAFTDFLSTHPTSLRAGRAALMLGNLLVRAGDPDAARAHFRTATSDPDPDVRAAAEKALAALTP